MESRRDTDVGAPAADAPGTPPRQRRWSGTTWRAILFAPIGDGQTRRRGSDGVRVGLSLLVILLCWFATKVNPSSEKALIGVVTPAPDGLDWLVHDGQVGRVVRLVAVVIILALVSRRMAVIRDAAAVRRRRVAHLYRAHGSCSEWTAGDRPAARPTGSRPVVSGGEGGGHRGGGHCRPAVPQPVAAADDPGDGGTVGSGHGGVGERPARCRSWPAWPSASWRRPSSTSCSARPSACRRPARSCSSWPTSGIVATGLVPAADQEWGVGRFSGQLDGRDLDVSVYGRDASDAQLLAKTTRFLLYRDSGPTLTFTRRQQVEHEAYVTLMAARAGARVSRVAGRWTGRAGQGRPAGHPTAPGPAAGRPFALRAARSDRRGRRPGRRGRRTRW